MKNVAFVYRLRRRSNRCFVTVVIDDIVVGTDVEDEVVVVGAGNEVVVITVLVTVVFTVCGCY